MFFCVTHMRLSEYFGPQSAHLRHALNIAHQSGPSAARETPYM